MAVKIFKDETVIGESYFNPVDFFGFLFPWTARTYQEDMLLNRKRNICCASARGIGKSIFLEGDVLYTARHNPKKEGLITAPGSAHLNPLFDKIIARIKESPILRRSTERIRRSPNNIIIFKNGFKLHGRIAGTSGGEGLLGLHVDFAWIDEGQLYMPQATEQLQGCLNLDCIIKIFGVPNGVRESYLYKCSVDPDYDQYKIPKFLDPSWCEATANRLRRIYGGENSQGWQNQVLANWGSLAHLTFPERHWRKCLVDVADYEPLIITGPDAELGIDYLRLASVPNNSSISISGDAGYDPDPSIIGIWAKRGEVSTLIHKIILQKISYSKQATFYDTLARYYDANFVAVDAGGAGRSILLDLDDEKLFPNKNYKVAAINFGGKVITEKKDDGKEIKEKTKFFSTLQLQSLFESGKIIFSKNDLQIEEEVHQSTQSKLADGTYIYNEDPDHNLAMIRCYTIAPWVLEQTTVVKKIGNRPCFGTVDIT